jgi:hypothetical protein
MRKQKHFGLCILFFGLIINFKTIGYIFFVNQKIESIPIINTVNIIQTITVILAATVILWRNKIDLKLFILRITASLLSICLIFSIIEMYFRIFDPHPYTFDKSDDLFQFNNRLGWEFIPNNAEHILLPFEHEGEIEINSLGMRDIEYTQDKPSGKNRIVVMGDSFTSGLGVENNEIFTEILESRLLTNWQVLNFGVNGYGPVQELIMFEDRAVKFKPDFTILVYYIRNDLDDTLGTYDGIKGYARPKVEVANNELKYVNLPLIKKNTKVETEILDQSPIIKLPFKITDFHFFNFIHIKLQDKNSILNLPPEVDLSKKEQSIEMKEGYAKIEQILIKMNAISHANNSKFLLVIAPTVIQIYEKQYWPEIMRIYHLNNNENDLLLPNKILIDICKKNNIDYLDLYASLKNNADKGMNLYYKINQHWNKQGHEVVAESIVSYLKSKYAL